MIRHQKRLRVSVVLGVVAMVIAALTGPMLYRRAVEIYYIDLLKNGEQEQQIEALKALSERRAVSAVPDIARLMISHCDVTNESSSGICWSCVTTLLALGKEGSAALFAAAIDDESGKLWKLLYQDILAPINIEGDQIIGALEASQEALRGDSTSKRCLAIQAIAYSCQDSAPCRYLKDELQHLCQDPNECISEGAKDVLLMITMQEAER